MPLADTRVKKAKPAEKDYKLSDEKGLYLLVKANGRKYWRLKYRLGGKEKLLAIGVYPDVSLKAARDARDKAREMVAQGLDPNQAKKERKAATSAGNLFEAIAREWYANQFPTWADATAKKRLALLENDLFPWLGARSVSDITSLDLLTCLRRIEARGANDTAHNARQVFNQIFRYARITQRTTNEPERDLQGALAPKGVKHRPAITDPEKFARLLLAIDNYRGSLVVRSLLALCPLLFQRPGEMIAMEWEQLDLEAGEWRYTPPKTIHKVKCPDGIPHIVPLSTQAVAILTDLYPLSGHGRFVFPSQRREGGHASAGTINKALQNMGYDTAVEHCAHGFRSSARTMLDEVLGLRVELIEHQLAHAVRDALGRAYNRTSHLPQRREMMQQWADYLDVLKLQAQSPKVVTGTFRKAK
ncbi:integrase arm-type DNA-binding domain-containing protein [Marinimicrobium sp. ABcell2]|uniref:tyrosine-type recombinase/integrase n=1 Tax=Marinimicrobium sp. ABcell2 TaxID=3069751 RepID=UPI0027AF4524|nr:integrase arm-type DNA-binding domain-containing protein [Marinimicrobium sp. ABcell2]MDQ2076082.1 integrase arm-type DNA-binding domain-containing protein [Marinimicrobium sp. ABcell2]